MPDRRLETRKVTRRALAGTLGLAAMGAETQRLARKVRVAIVGLEGHPTEITKPLDRLPDVEIVAIASPDAGLIERFARGKARLAGAKPYADYRRMLDAEKPDVVAVCNDNGARAAAIVEAAQRKMNVIAEKPLGLDWPSLNRVKAAVKQNQIQLGMLLPMRYEPPYQMLKQIVDSGEIGEVIQIGAQKSYQLGNREAWYKQRSTYGSTILWIGIHMFDLMRHTSGREFTQVSGFMGRPGFPQAGEMETTTSSSFAMDNGGTATLHMDYCRPAAAPAHGDDRLRLAGTKGVVEYLAATGVTLMTATVKPHRIEPLPADGSVFFDYIASVYAGAKPTLSLTDIYRNCEVTIAAHEAAVSGKVVPCTAR